MATTGTLFDRVQEDADAIGTLLLQGTNAPLNDYVDETDIYGLCDAFSLSPDEWPVGGLEQILIIRDGLYRLRNSLRDRSDGAEHSVDQLLYAFDRLYADLEHALHELSNSEIETAQRHLETLQKSANVPTRNISIDTKILENEAREVLTQSHINVRKIEFFLLKIDRSQLNIEVLKDARLVIKRLSASVFAMKLSLEQNVVFEGVFKFLSENADTVLQQLREVVEGLKGAYDTTTDFIADLTRLAEKGGRFARLVRDFIERVFGDSDEPNREQIKLVVQSVGSGYGLLCGIEHGANRVILAGKNGVFQLFNSITGKLLTEARFDDDVTGLAAQSDGILAVGTSDGLEVVELVGQVRAIQQAPFRENVSAIATPQWTERSIVTGSRDGMLRHWTLAGGLSQVERSSYRRIDRTIIAVIPWKNALLVASKERIHLIDEELYIKKTIPMPSLIENICTVSDESVAVCGKGLIAQINIEKGAYIRLFSASSIAKYTAIGLLNTTNICVGDDDGNLTIFDFEAGLELGSVDVGLSVRGIIPITNTRRVAVFGGSRRSFRGRTVAWVEWEDPQHA